MGRRRPAAGDATDAVDGTPLTRAGMSRIDGWARGRRGPGRVAIHCSMVDLNHQGVEPSLPSGSGIVPRRRYSRTLPTVTPARAATLAVGRRSSGLFLGDKPAGNVIGVRRRSPGQPELADEQPREAGPPTPSGEPTERFGTLARMDLAWEQVHLDHFFNASTEACMWMVALDDRFRGSDKTYTERRASRSRSRSSAA